MYCAGNVEKGKSHFGRISSNHSECLVSVRTKREAIFVFARRDKRLQSVFKASFKKILVNVHLCQRTSQIMGIIQLYAVVFDTSNLFIFCSKMSSLT